MKTICFIESLPNRYGFGRDWTLVVKHGKTSRKFWLGQDAKVFSRIIGIDHSYAVDHYSEKAGSRNWDDVEPFIREDLIDALTQGQGPEALLEANDWDLAAE